jgi:CRISPR/Cas system-associated protein Csx1
MKNLWPEEFKPKEIKSVKAIIDEQSKLLPKITGDLVYANVKKMGLSEAFKGEHVNDFSYSFYLVAKFLEGYSFKILDFSHPITIYPVKVTLDELIADEIQCDREFDINNENEFISILGKVVNSDRIKDVVGSIIRLSSEQ